MNLFEFEKNIEHDLVLWFAENDIESHATRSTDELNVSNIQIAFNYDGALEDTRQLVNGVHEFNTHQGNLVITVNTFRGEDHHARVAKIRSLLLHHSHGASTYHLFEIQPLNTAYLESEELNADQSQLNYQIKFRIDLSSFQYPE